MNNTIFDDVFRTMVEKLPELVIPLINEAFGTIYPPDTRYEQLRNEHQLPDGEIITDSCLRIGNCFYHIECQSTDDKTMAIRMVEYDFHIALGHVERDGHRYMMEFPKSCVLYIRYGKNIPDNLEVDVIFPDRSTHTYRIPTIKVSDYSEDDIIQKNLFLFLPYYILRYEKFLKEMENNPEKVAALKEEYEKIKSDLQVILKDNNIGLLSDLMELIEKVADYVLKSHQSIRKELDFMGGKILKLQSEKLLEKGEQVGETRFATLVQKLSAEGRMEEISKAATDSEFRKELYKKYKIEISESKSETAMYG